MCLKRYSMSSNGRATRLDTHVDIPTEIGLPYFIQGDNLDTDGPIHGNFKLSLQALVCHRGNSVDSGHYIAIVRGTSAGAPPAGSDQADSDPERYWMRFDDLAAERVTLVDIEQALKRESPYLLFYQILPMDEDPALANMSGTPISSASDDTQAFESKRLSQKIRGLFNWNFSGGRSDEHASSRPSFEISRPDSETELSGQIGRKANTAEPNSGGTDHTRGIEVHTEPQASPRLAPRDERDSSSSFSFSRRNSRPKSNPGSRAGSQVAENRISTTLSRLTRRLSRDKLATSGHPPDSEGSPVQNSPPEQMDGKSGGGDKSKGGTGHVSDQKGKWKAKSKAKTKSKEKKAGRSSERDCAFM